MVITLGLHNIHPTTHVGLAHSQACDYDVATIERFWAKVQRRGSTECWLWTANRVGRRGMHGQFTLPRNGGPQQRHIYAHRFIWTLVHGPIPDGLNVCHHCDVGLCCNPAHLFLGTQDDNLKDAARKGRFHTPRTTAAFCLADRLAIYWMPSAKGLVTALARQHHVSKPAISNIRKGRFVGAPCLERVPHRNLPVMGEVS